MLAIPAAHTLMLGTLVHVVTGWDLGISTLVGTAVGTLFLYKGGLLADVRVGMLAFLMMYVGFLVIVVWCLTHYPPGEMFASLDPSLKKFDGNAGLLGFRQLLYPRLPGRWSIPASISVYQARRARRSESAAYMYAFSSGCSSIS